MTLRSLCVPILFILLACGQLHAGMTYIALGDSNVFGNDESRPASTVPNYGDQGYVHPFADFLGTLNGGVRPDLANLAISGELASSFLTGIPPTDWPFRAWQWNLHYPNATTSQNSLMLTALESAHAAGNSVYVTLNIGINDFTYLVSTAAYQSASPTEQQALIAQLFGQIAQDYGTILTEIEMHAPGAHILLPNIFDTTLPTDPAYASNELLQSNANSIIQQIAAGFGATYVDFHSVIQGNVVAYVNYNNGTAGHLNQAGYDAVALALEGAVVPEPASVTMLGIGLVGILGYGWRIRKRTFYDSAKQE